MRQTALEIFYDHFGRWSGICLNLHNDIYHVVSIEEEIKHEADNYVQQLSQYGDKWKAIIERDLKELCEYLIPLGDTLLFHKREEWKKELEDNNHHVICTFIRNIRESLFRNGYEYQTELTPQTVLALIYFHWPKDDTELSKMIDFVRNHVVELDGVELFPDATDLTPATANNEKQEKGKAGKKPAKDFREYFLPGIDADILLPILHDYIDGNVGKELAKYIVAITNVWIEEPGHKSVCKEFKASESAYKEAIDKHYCRNQYSGVRKDKIGKPFPEKELAAIRNIIKKRIEEINGDTSTP